MDNLIQGAIPGQSLTDLPKNSPWERPSELNEVKDVVDYYLMRLIDQDTVDDISILFDLGGDLRTVTEAMWLAGAMKGIHTIEAGMLAAPVISSFLKTALATYGIDAPETGADPNEVSKGKERKRLQLLIDDAIDKGLESGEDDSGIELLRSIKEGAAVTPETATEGDAPTETIEESMPMEEPSVGLMSREEI
jgi:hypothetical protein|tara:strand:+ start:124 stop:702 length:579 start_codon:yes stop_codon:yes gene_type:complete